jgi:hypothetical protein
MIINNLDKHDELTVGITLQCDNQSPLVVEPDRILSGTVTLELFKA